MSNVVAFGYGRRSTVQGNGPVSFGYGGFYLVPLAILRESVQKVLIKDTLNNNFVSASKSSLMDYATYQKTLIAQGVLEDMTAISDESSLESSSFEQPMTGFVSDEENQTGVTDADQMTGSDTENPLLDKATDDIAEKLQE